MTDNPLGTVELKEHLEKIMRALEARMEERIDSVEQVQTERWKGHMAIHEQGQISLDIIIKSLDSRLYEMNKFRSQITEERSQFVDKALFYLKQDEVNKDISSIEKWKSNIEGRLWMLGMALGAFVVLVNILIRLLFK